MDEITKDHGREIFWGVLVTKSQAVGILKAMDLDCEIPKKGLMQVFAFPCSDLVAYLYWTKAVSEGGERLYRYELERNCK